MIPLVRNFFLFLIITSLSWSCRTEKEVWENPNLVYILADDLGYGDVSSFNPASKIITPKIDIIASEGIMFLDAHSGSAVCTPTRYGILTGRYSWRTRLKQGVLWRAGTDRLLTVTGLPLPQCSKKKVIQQHVSANGILDWDG